MKLLHRVEDHINEQVKRAPKPNCNHRRRTHRGNGSFAPVLLKVPGQTYLYTPVLFGL